MKKKTILIIGDRIDLGSGVSNQLKHVVKKFIQNDYDVVTIGVINDNSNGEITPPQPYKFDSGEETLIYSSKSYDNLVLIEHCIKTHNVDALVLMTDNYRYQNIWNYGHSIRQHIPIYYIAVWDSCLVPLDPVARPHYNLVHYESVDAIGCISKQTEWFVNRCFDKHIYGKKPSINYVAHGSNIDTFTPLPPQELTQLRNKLFRGNEYDFVLFFNGRNQGRKKIGDIIEAFRLFNEKLTPEQARKTSLVLHTDVVSDYGTDLVAVCSSLAPRQNIYIDNQRHPESIMNMLYNIADVTINISNAAGFELSINESMLAGTPVIASATGGHNDQIGWFKDGITPQWSMEFRNNLQSLGHGVWSKPVFTQRTNIGNPATPYLWDDNASIDETAAAIRYWYDIPPYERERMGRKGREYAISMGMTSKDFAVNVVDGVEKMINNFTPLEAYNLYKI